MPQEAKPTYVTAPVDISKMLTVDKAMHRLTLWRWNPERKRYVRERVWQIAVGAQGYDTPNGMYYTQAKFKNPAWKKPDSPWVPEEERGVLVPGGTPENPLVGWFIKIADTDGVGIHGTRNVESIGTNASHGCIRMTPEDVQQVAELVGLGIRVFIH